MHQNPDLLRIILIKQVFSAMEEPQRRSILYFIEKNRASEICRLVYCAKTENESSDLVLKAFSSAAKDYSSEAVTGLLLVYPGYLVNLIEAPEEEIFQLCRHFFKRCSTFIKRTKCFPVQVEVGARFFDKWYARKAAEYKKSNFEERSGVKVVEDNFQNVSSIYKKTIFNLYQFYTDLKLLNKKNHTTMVELLESLNEDGHRLLAEKETMEFILNSCWGQSLEELTDRFLNPISIDPNIAWPFPKVTLPRVDFKKMDRIKDLLRANAEVEKTSDPPLP